VKPAETGEMNRLPSGRRMGIVNAGTTLAS
jgi:hypothetical protein